MKKVIQLFALAITIMGCSLHAADAPMGIYKAELKTLTESKAHEILFNERANPALRDILKDVQNGKEMSSSEQRIRSIFLSRGGIVVTQDTMPNLHKYITELCQKQGMKVPIVFITREKNLLNAFAQKLLTSSGGILIGRELLDECSDDEIEAIVAREIGHVYHNHANKKLLLNYSIKATLAAATVAGIGALGYVFKEPIVNQWDNMAGYEKERLMKIIVAPAAIPTVALLALVVHGAAAVPTTLIIGKSQEKQADKFAFQAGKSEGLIKFLERLKQKEAKVDQDFEMTSLILSNNSNLLPPDLYRSLRQRYYMAIIGHKISKGFGWLYRRTAFDSLPSHDARIAAAQKYQKEEAEKRSKKVSKA